MINLMVFVAGGLASVLIKDAVEKNLKKSESSDIPKKEKEEAPKLKKSADSEPQENEVSE